MTLYGTSETYAAESSQQSTHQCHGTTADLTCYVDGIQLVIEAIKLSLALNEKSAQDAFNTQLTAEYKWFLGVEASQKTVPLLRVISASYLEDESGSKLFFFFHPFNLKSESTQLCNYKNRHGNYISIGDLILFAFQMQTGVTSSRTITELGHLPISPLERKSLALWLTPSHLKDQFQNCSFTYNAKEMLTQVSLIHPTRAVVCSSLETFSLLFPQDTLDQLSFSVVFHDHDAVSTHDAQEPSNSLGSFPPSTSDGSPLPKSCVTLPTETSLESSLTHRRHLTDDPLLQCFPYVNDLLNPFTLMRTEGKGFGDEIYHIFKRQNSPTKQQSQTTQAVTLNISKTPSVVYTPQDSPCPPRTHFSSDSGTILDVLGYLKKHKRKPLIIIPSYLAQNSIPPVLHTINCKQFLEHKVMNVDVKAVRDSAPPPAFYWKAHVPWTDANDRHQTLVLDFKVVGSSQVYSLTSNRPIPSIVMTTINETLCVRLMNTSVIRVKTPIFVKAVKFSFHDWSRVVAVVVQGPEWQFHHWPFSNLKVLFDFIKPVYFAYETETLPSLVTEFNINVLRVRRTSRHGDIAVWNQFMEFLSQALHHKRDSSVIDMKKLKH